MRIILSLILSVGMLLANAQSVKFGNKAKIYLVRHAEKQLGDDPLLTTEGNKRAGDLMRGLQDKRIRRIYVTQYKRTQNTADSLRIQLTIDTVDYLADTSCVDLFNKLTANSDGNKTILIIGHSNTIPGIIRKLGVADYPLQNIPDAEFDNLFLVRFKKGKANVVKVKYGASPGASDAMQ